MRGTPPESRVYFIEDESTSLIKIGFSIDVRRRIQQLAFSLNRPLILRAAVFGGRPLERRLHRAFHKGRQQGEWFTATTELRTLIDVANRVGNDGPEVSTNPRTPLELRGRFGLIVKAASVLQVAPTANPRYALQPVVMTATGVAAKRGRPATGLRIPRERRPLFQPAQVEWLKERAEALGHVTFDDAVRMTVWAAMGADNRRSAS